MSPEECGGPFGYAERLQILADPEHDDHGEVRRWLGPGFDPEALDLGAVNAVLARMR